VPGEVRHVRAMHLVPGMVLSNGERVLNSQQDGIVVRAITNLGAVNWIYDTPVAIRKD
jgi:hypothetical protein